MGGKEDPLEYNVFSAAFPHGADDVVVGIISKCVGNRIFVNTEHSSTLLKICQMKISSSFLSS